LLGVVTSSLARPQAVAGGGTIEPAFEAVSIRPDDPDTMARMVRMAFEPDGYSASHATLRLLIKDAYGVGDNQIFDAPVWVSSERYEIEAKIDLATANEIGQLSEEQRKIARQHMLQALLADRFKLTLHRETREMAVYSLVIAKNGPKFKQAAPGDAYSKGLTSPSGNLVGSGMMLMRLGGGQIGGQGVPLDLLVKQLSAQLHQIVQDKTGLTGLYDFSLQWTPDLRQAPAGAEGIGDETDPSPGAAGGSVFTALQEQLGLKLEPTKGPVEVLVIDHIDRPSGN
jgi:uncharacterized protein (TIGR03435 family)